MKIYYYNPYIELNGVKTNIPFYSLLDYIYGKTSDEKLKNIIRYGDYSLMKMRNPTENRDYSDRSVCFVDYRDRKPRISERGTDRYEDIEDDVIESTNLFYHTAYNLLLMEYNHYGAKALQFERYLSLFLPSTEDITWSVVMEPIPARIGLADVLNSNKIKSLELKLDLSIAQQRLFLETVAPESITLNALQGIVASHGEIGGNVATVSFGNGRKSNNQLDTEEVKNIIRSLDLESNTYINIKVNYFSPALGKTYELDLKNANILKDEVEVAGDAWEIITETLEDTFYEFRNGVTGHSRFIGDTIVAEIPF